MCGILMTCGLDIAFHHRRLASLRRRGPDEIGFWMNGDVRLAHTRLAIIGLDERGVEPLENERHVIAYNGEIYNFPEIRRRLQQQGVRASLANDAEVLLQAWTTWGPSVLTELDGFWAFVVYDKEERSVTLVRDQFGVKPLYYWHDGSKVCAASLLSTVVDALGRTPSLDTTALSEYVRYQYTFGDRTFLKGVRKVLPGHFVRIDLESGDATTSCYEDILAIRHDEYRSLTPEWIEETRALVRECVLASTISDTSFTTFCSGGIDSSLITRLAGPDVAYHCNFSDAECNETFFAKQVVEGTPTRLMVVNAQESFNLVERVQSIIRDFDEPSIGSVILPLDDLLAQVKRRYKVILTGTGGDEFFAGYTRYQLALGECHQDSYKGLFQRMEGLPSVADRFELAHTKGSVDLYRFYEPEVEETFRGAYEECRLEGDDLLAMLRFDRRYFLAGLLNIDDKMCGRHSLESRPSFLHQRLVRHVQGLHPRCLLRDAELKPVLRDVAQGVLPASVVRRTDKMGFTTPIGTFVNKSAGYIREQITGSKYRDLYALQKMSFTADTKFSREVFGLLMLDCWLNQYVGS